jgi:hypothetical protein
VYDATPSPPSSSPRPSPRRTGEFGTAPSSPLDRVLARYHPRREVSSSPLCGTNAGAVHLTCARRAPPLPFPRAPIKRSPRAPPSPHRPQPPLSSPRPSSIREAPPSSPSLVSPSLSSPSPSGLRSKKLARPISFAPPPQVWNATPLPQSPPEAHRRRLPPRSSATTPRTAPSWPPLAKLSPPLGSPAPPHAKAPTCCPRTGSPAANRRRAHRRPGPPLRTAGSSHRQPLTSFSPPSALSGVWAPQRRRRPRTPAPSPALGHNWAGALAPARSAIGWASSPPPPTAHQKLNSFFFFSLFPFN